MYTADGQPRVLVVYGVLVIEAHATVDALGGAARHRRRRILAAHYLKRMRVREGPPARDAPGFTSNV